MHLLYMCLAKGTFWKHVVAYDILVIDAVIMLTSVAEIELLDVFVIHVFASDTFWKLPVALDRLAIDALIILTLVAEMKIVNAFVKQVFASDMFWKHAVPQAKLRY